MSGEKSKSSGEFGETIVTEFLKLIGWSSATPNPTITCWEPDKHKRPRKKHGVDFIHNFESPLMNDTQEDIIISVKHTVNDYPKNPTNDFKKYILDLSRAIECYPSDSQYGKYRVNNYIKEHQRAGILFWISSDKNAENRDITAEITNFRISELDAYGPIYLVDNKKIDFLIKSIKYAKRKYDDIKFNYHHTGYNLGSNSIDSGNILPVQFITTNILPLRAEGNILLLFLNEPFSENSLKRSMGFAKAITSTWPKSIVILYPNYFELEDREVVQSVKRLFNEEAFISIVKVRSFIEDMKSFGEEG